MACLSHSQLVSVPAAYAIAFVAYFFACVECVALDRNFALSGVSNQNARKVRNVMNVTK